LAHFPSGHFHANGAWTVLAVLAHNLLRWTQLLGLPDTTVRAARTLRRRLLSIPGRLTRHARGWMLHLPARWPWHGDSSTRSTASERSPPPPDARPRPTDNQQTLRPAGRDPAAREHPPHALPTSVNERADRRSRPLGRSSDPAHPPGPRRAVSRL